jgi:hypothetical protein
VTAQAAVTVDSVAITTFSVAPTAINPGQQATLSWQTARATSANISGVGNVPLSGSQQVGPLENTAYTLICQGPNGPVNQTVNLTVNSVKFTSASGWLNDPNNTPCTISWTTLNATSVELLDPWSNRWVPVALNGQYQTHTYIDAYQNFVIHANGPGPSPASVTVPVNGPFG